MTSSNTSRALPLISFIVFVVDVACFACQNLGTCLGEHRRAVIANDASQPVARHFNSVLDMKMRALCPISGNKDSRKDMKCVSFPNFELYTF